MDIVTVLQQAGPYGAMLVVFFYGVKQFVSATKSFHSNLIIEMREDRKLVREEFKAFRAEHREDMIALRDELAEIRKDK